MREREIFSLKYGAQFTNRAIAKIVGVTESNLGTILHRIVTHLRERMEMEHESGGMHPYAPVGMYEGVLVTDQRAILIRGHLVLKQPGEKARKWDETLGLQLHWTIGEYVYALETFGPYLTKQDLIRMAESMEALPAPWAMPTP